MKENNPKVGRDIVVTLATALVASVMGYGAVLSLEEPIGALALIYMVSMLSLTWRYPHMGLALTLGLAPFQNDVSNGLGPFKLSLGELSLFMCFIVYLIRWIMKHCEAKRGPYFSAILIYFFICISSSLANWSDTALTALLQMSLYFMMAPIVFANFVKKVELLTIGLYMNVVTCVFLSCYGLATGSFYMFGLHKNGVGSSLAMGVVIGTELFLVQKKRMGKGLMLAALTFMTGGLIFTVSRGSWLGALVGYFVVVGTRGKAKSIFQSILLLVPLVAVFWLLLPEDKQEYATSFDSKRENISARYETIALAQQKFSESPIFGVGVSLRKEMDATNVVWITLAETGIQGLVAFAMVHFITLVMVFRTQKFVDRSDPRFSMLVLGGALLFAKIMHGTVDHYWSRGPILVAWACCGISTRIYFHEQERLAKLRISIMKARRKKMRAIKQKLAQAQEAG
jgi:O-Antigen ligase